MSNYSEAIDSLQHAIDIINSERDLMLRVKDAMMFERRSQPIITRMVTEAAYDARMVFSTSDIAEVLDMDRGTVQKRIQRHCAKHGLPDPIRRKSVDLGDYIDLSHLVSGR